MSTNSTQSLWDKFRHQNYVLFCSDERDGRLIYFATQFGLCHLLTRDDVYAFIDSLEARGC